RSRRAATSPPATSRSRTPRSPSACRPSAPARPRASAAARSPPLAALARGSGGVARQHGVDARLVGAVELPLEVVEALAEVVAAAHGRVGAADLADQRDAV